MAQKNTYRIVTLPGDGIGPEVMAEGKKVLATVARLGRVSFEIEEIECGGHYYQLHGREWPEGSEARCDTADAMLLGAVGHQIDGKDVFTRPGEPYPTPQLAGYAQVIGNRRRLALYANVRPVKLYKGVKQKICNKFVEVWDPAAVDYVIVRENTEGEYTGETRTLEDEKGVAYGAETPIRITRAATERVCRYAFRLARKRAKLKKVTCVEKSNIVGAHKYFRTICTEVGREFPDITLDFAYFDAFCQWQLRNPEWFDIVVAPNLVGDTVSDNGSTTAGGMGFAAGGNIGDEHAMFEPIHGSAPKYTGQDKVNPCATILAVRMMLEWLGDRYGDERLRKGAGIVERAVADVMAAGKVATYDQGGSSKCSQMGTAVAERVKELFQGA
ncbi:MAG: isocitrate/isopropylmalate dehydrogenase family protein [Planctomycetes bacterium]|nr:isocitrate/isopropylmalate dehydrogenase family protein [Planctomycetota bacterium]